MTAEEVQQMPMVEKIMTAEEVQHMSMVEKIRAIKVLTPGAYAFHSWMDGNNHNGLVVNTMLLTLAAGGTLVR